MIALRAGRSLLTLIAALGCHASALAGDKTISGDAQTRFLQEPAPCLDGRSKPDRRARKGAAAPDAIYRGLVLREIIPPSKTAPGAAPKPAPADSSASK
jgi:hypothetical protein